MLHSGKNATNKYIIFVFRICATMEHVLTAYIYFRQLYALVSANSNSWHFNSIL